jgi:hypothetical protein
MSDQPTPECDSQSIGTYTHINRLKPIENFVALMCCAHGGTPPDLSVILGEFAICLPTLHYGSDKPLQNPAEQVKCDCYVPKPLT